MKRSEYILEQVESKDIFSHYLKPYHNFATLQQGKNISNPFLSQPQKTPSFNIFQDKSTNVWRYKDFATDDQGNCFELVMKLFDLNFMEALERIETDFNLESRLTSENHKSQYRLTEKNTIETSSFWKQYDIKLHILKKYNVVELKNYRALSRTGKSYKVEAKDDNPIFCYKEKEWSKIYKPYDGKYKFQHLGNKPADYIFGYKQLPDQDEILFITGGEKDVLTLVSQNFNAISLNSETATLQPEIAQELKQRFTKIIVLYDNDDTGLKQSDILSNTHGFYRMVLPQLIDNGKDISDFIKQKRTLSEFQDILINTLSQVLPEPTISDNETQEQEERVVYNAIELMAMDNIEPKYLMHPIFPQKGSAVLAGKPDTGKSQFARQLCIEVALGKTSFLNFDLAPRHNKSIYVATEDNLEATQYLLSKQLNGLASTARENLKFVFADTMGQEDIIKTLNTELTKEPADLVVVDSFGDIFTGRDSNNNIAMRNTVKTFDKIAKHHNCLILFVHHINKGAYRQAPGQEHIQGGAGLVQKVRLAIQLTEGDGNKRYFTVVKGNYCTKEYKQNSLQLEFSEQTFLFTNTGILIPTGQLGTKEETTKKEEKFNELKDIAIQLFNVGDMLNYGKLVERFCDITNQSAPTAKKKNKAHVRIRNHFKI